MVYLSNGTQFNHFTDIIEADVLTRKKKGLGLLSEEKKI